MNSELLEKILAVAVQAPSGDNSQPWRFKYDNRVLTVVIEPEKDHPILNVDNGGTFIALGALLYNLQTAAKHYGYEAIINPIEQLEATSIAITFQVTQDRSTSVADVQTCFDRHTNRKPYDGKPIPKEILDEIIACVKTVPDVTCQLVTDSSNITELADAISLMERITLRTKQLHRIFFKDIFWNKRENNAGKSGLYIKTMELPSPAQFILRLLRYWPIMSLFNLFGFADKVANSNAQTYAATAAIGIIAAPGTTPMEYVRVGMAFEKIWLLMTQNEIALQPTAGTIYLIKYLRKHQAQEFLSTNDQVLLKQAEEKITNIFHQDKMPGMMFRIGYTQPPTAVSTRKKPIIEYTKV